MAPRLFQVLIFTLPDFSLNQEVLLQKSQRVLFGFLARVLLPGRNVKIMNNQPDSEFQDNGQVDEMLPEYEFNYRKARPNRFASRATVTVK